MFFHNNWLMLCKWPLFIEYPWWSAENFQGPSLIYSSRAKRLLFLVILLSERYDQSVQWMPIFVYVFFFVISIEGINNTTEGHMMVGRIL